MSWAKFHNDHLTITWMRAEWISIEFELRWKNHSWNWPVSTIQWKVNSMIHVYSDSLGLSEAIWRYRPGSILVQVMACCLTAPSHHLNQCWLIIKGVLWHSPVTIAQEVTVTFCSEITLLKLPVLLHLPGASEYTPNTLKYMYDDYYWSTSELIPVKYNGILAVLRGVERLRQPFRIILFSENVL